MFFLVGNVSAGYTNWWSGSSGFEENLTIGGYADYFNMLTKMNNMGYIYLSGNATSENSTMFTIDPESGFTEIVSLTDGIWQPTSLEVGSNTLWIGKNVGVAGVGHHLATESPDGHLHLHAHNEFDGQVTTQDTQIVDAYSYQERAVFQPDNSSTWTGNNINFTIFSPYHLLANDAYYQIAATAATQPLRFRLWEGTNDTGTLIFDQTYPASQFPANTEIQITANGYIEFEALTTYFTKITSDAAFSLRMDTTDTTPWFASDISFLREDNLLQTAPWVNGTNYTEGTYMIYNRTIMVVNETGVQTGSFESNIDKWYNIISKAAMNYWTKLGNVLSFNGDVDVGGNLNVTGNTNIDNGTLYVNANNNSVGIRSNNPIETLTIEGALAMLREGTIPNSTADYSKEFSYIKRPNDMSTLVIITFNDWETQNYTKANRGLLSQLLGITVNGTSLNGGDPPLMFEDDRKLGGGYSVSNKENQTIYDMDGVPGCLSRESSSVWKVKITDISQTNAIYSTGNSDPTNLSGISYTVSSNDLITKRWFNNNLVLDERTSGSIIKEGKYHLIINDIWAYNETHNMQCNYVDNIQQWCTTFEYNEICGLDYMAASNILVNGDDFCDCEYDMALFFAKPIYYGKKYLEPEDMFTLAPAESEPCWKTGQGTFRCMSDLMAQEIVHPILQWAENNIDSYFDAGNLGVGTDNPQWNLHAYSGHDDYPAMFESSNGSAYILLKDASTSTDTSVRLGVRGDDLTFWADGAEKAFVSQSGLIIPNDSVGIGTDNPIGLLNIDNDGTNSLSLHIDHGTATGTGIILYNSASSTMSTVDGLFRVHQQSTTASAPAVTIRQDGTGNFLEVSNNAQTSDIFIINSSGNVGIGTDTPATRLHIQGATDTDDSTLFISTDANAEDETASLQFGIPSRGSSSIIKAKSGSAGSSTLIFEVGYSHDLVAERMRIDSDGLQIQGGDVSVGSGVGDSQRTLNVYGGGTAPGKIALWGASTGQYMTLTSKGNGNTRPGKIETPFGLELDYGISGNEELGFKITENGAPRFIISDGNVSIGTPWTTRKLFVLTTGDNNVFRVEDRDGSCEILPISSSLSCASDIRLKENIIDSGDVLDYLDLIRIREFDLKGSGEHRTGAIAQELRETHPELVNGNEEEDFLMAQAPDNWVLIKAIQELREMFESLVGEGFTGSCINVTYSGGIAISCND